MYNRIIYFLIYKKHAVHLTIFGVCSSMRLPLPLLKQAVKNLPAVRRPEFAPWVGRSSGEGNSYPRGNGTPLQYACLENPMDRGAW